MAAEREKRIEHAQHMAAMRIIKKDLVLGWTCWHEKWSAYARKRRLLQGAASRLAKPKLVACVHVWRKDWEVTMARKAKLSHKEQLVQSENLAASLQREVAQLKARLIEIGGKHEQERQAERERRIEQVGQMAMLRIVKKDLALGWTTWYDLYEARARSKRLLQGAAGRIAKPKLAAAVSWWRRDYLAASSMSHTEMVASEKSMRIAAEAEANRLREELKQARQAALDGTGREKELARQHEAKMEEEREKRIEHAQHMAAMRIVKKELVLGWTTWHDQWEGQARAKRLIAGAGARLTKPKLVACVQQWRRDWEVAEKERKQMSHEERFARSRMQGRLRRRRRIGFVRSWRRHVRLCWMVQAERRSCRGSMRHRSRLRGSNV